MLIRQLLLIVTGASYGLLSAAGVFTVLVAVGLIPRFAGKTHTARYVLLYEEMVIFGTLAGCFVTIFPEYSQWRYYSAGTLPGTDEAVDGSGHWSTGGFRAVCRNVHRLSGAGHC